MPRLLPLVALLVLAGCDAAEPPPIADACPFPASGFAEPPGLFSPAPGDTVRVGEPFLLSFSFFGFREGGNDLIAIGRDVSLVWTSADGADRRVLAPFEWLDEPVGAIETRQFIADLRVTLRPIDVAALPPGGTAAMEVGVTVVSTACDGADPTDVVARSEVVLLP